MDLSTLPFLVLQTIIEGLDRPSLVSISYTCRTLNIEANRRLYRSPYDFIPYALSTAQSSLHIHHVLCPRHSALPFLRTYYACNLQNLDGLWSKTPLYLHSIMFLSSCFNDSESTKTSSQCFDSKLPGTSVTEVEVCWPWDNRNEERASSLLGLLHRLDSLASLRIVSLSHFRRYYPNIDEMIKAINCPQLKSLYISDADILPCLRDKLPSLEVLWIEGDGSGNAWTYSDSKYYTPHEKWRRLEHIMERRILFLDTHNSMDVVQPLPFVFSYASRYGPVDSTSMATWLLHSHHVLDKTRLHPRATPHSLNLDRFYLHSRDKTIPLLHDLNYTSLRLRLYAHDTHIAHQLPQSLVSLHLITSDRSALSAVPNILLTLSKLKRVTIQLNVEISDSGEWIGFEEIFPPLEIDYGSIRDEDSYLFRHYKLELHRDGVLCWKEAKSDCFDGDSGFTHTNDVHIPELEGAVTDWLSLNPSLDSIKLLLSPDDTADYCIDEDLP